MNMKKLIQIVIVTFLLIALINLGFLISMFFFKDTTIYTISSIIAGLLQIAIIIISTTLVNKNINGKLTVFLIIMMLMLIITTFFIPVQTIEVFGKPDKSGLAPAVMPSKEEFNLYHITLSYSFLK